MDEILPQKLEIVLSLVTPLGADKELFLELLKNIFNEHKIKVIHIRLSQLLISDKKSEGIPISFQYYLKMQICSEMRKKYSRGVLVKNILDKISLERSKLKPSDYPVVYLIDQLKNMQEAKVLNHIYGMNYIQISLFSSEIKRIHSLKEKFNTDQNLPISNNKKLKKWVIENVKVNGKNIIDVINPSQITKWVNSYSEDILRDAINNLIKKDFKETDFSLANEGYGQEVSDLFHRAHYFINVDSKQKKLEVEIEKFVKLLLGIYEGSPTQDEFGMTLSHQVSVRSNFPNDRQIGASIISEYGEVISAASIRAPSKFSNPSLEDTLKIKPGYEKYRAKIITWNSMLDNFAKLNKQSKHTIKDLQFFIKNSLEFHPCTHAEIAALLDAAKLGVSVRNATLYTTTFPCHLCAKDIITAGISRVVYLEAYTKSKNKELYPDNIAFDTDCVMDNGRIAFDFYCGIGPKRFYYAYLSENKSKEKTKILPWLNFELPKYYKMKEEDISALLTKILKDKDISDDPLYELLMKKEK